MYEIVLVLPPAMIIYPSQLVFLVRFLASCKDQKKMFDFGGLEYMRPAAAWGGVNRTG